MQIITYANKTYFFSIQIWTTPMNKSRRHRTLQHHVPLITDYYWCTGLLRHITRPAVTKVPMRVVNEFEIWEWKLFFNEFCKLIHNRFCPRPTRTINLSIFHATRPHSLRLMSDGWCKREEDTNARHLFVKWHHIGHLRVMFCVW